MRKQYILYMVVIVILFSSITINNNIISINSNNVSALSYSSSVGVGFTFDPTLSVNISPSDLTISNLSPGTTADSNMINVSVASNAAYGYTLSANVNNENLVHSNNINAFSSIAINADLSDLENSEDTNIWGYSYRNNIASPSTWSNYNGLSNSSNTILLDNSNVADSTGGIDFKIAAKAGSTQPSGEYTGAINFIAVTKVAPMSLLDSFIASGAEQLNGYYKMQDMTHDICEAVDVEESELQLIDVRDNKIYWVAKLKDGNCWMTQNLDFNIQKDTQGNTVALTSELTDLVDGSLAGAYANGYTYTPNPDNPDTTDIYNGLITWTPNNSTNKAYTLTTLIDWAVNNTEPYSYDRGEFYPDNTVNEINAGSHALNGNYYNWTAAIASNNSYNVTANHANNSLCPKKWHLPTSTEYNNLYNNYRNENISDIAFGLMREPTWFIRSGSIGIGELNGSGNYGNYWTSTVRNNDKSYSLLFNNNYVAAAYNNHNRSSGFSIRCLAR